MNLFYWQTRRTYNFLFKKYYKRATQLDPEYAAENAGRLSIALQLLENPNFFFNDTAKINSLHSIDSQFLTPR